MSQCSVDHISISQAEFEKSIEYPTLCFRDSSLEAKFHEKHMKDAIRSKTFKIGLAMLLFDIIFRRTETLILVIQGVKSIAKDLNCEILQTSLLFFVLFLEAIFAYIGVLNVLKGLMGMIYIFFMVIYTSMIYQPEVPISVPMYFW